MDARVLCQFAVKLVDTWKSRSTGTTHALTRNWSTADTAAALSAGSLGRLEEQI